MSKIYDVNGSQIRPIDRWAGKTIAFFGDSRTWYDGQNYISTTKSEWRGKKCRGYQQEY